MIVVTLPPNVIDYADAVGATRQGQAFIKQRPNKNNLVGSFDKMLEYHRMGARCEAAGKLFLNPIRWHALVERVNGIPDLGDFVDVKGRSRDHYDLPVQKDGVPDWAYLLITAESHPDYQVHGWAWGHEAMQACHWQDPAGGRPAYFVKQTDLRDPLELLAEVRSRDKVSTQEPRRLA